MFQFLIGIINLACKNGRWFWKTGVSIPHRYYKSYHLKTRLWRIFMFQFLIGIINLFKRGRRLPLSYGFQFLIGIINRENNQDLWFRIQFQFLIGIINQEKIIIWFTNEIVSIPHRYYKSLRLKDIGTYLSCFNSS